MLNRLYQPSRRDWLEVNPFAIPLPRIGSVPSYLEDEGFWEELKKLLRKLVELFSGFIKPPTPEQPIAVVSERPRTEEEKVVSSV